MAAYNIYEAKTAFSALIEKAENGEETVIARSGKPVAKIVPIDRPKLSGDNKSRLYRNSFGANHANLKEFLEVLDQPLHEEEQRAFGMID